MLGKLSDLTIQIASQRGIPITTGSIRPKDGRILIFCRAFPGAHKSGYALRSRIVWWLHTGEVIRGMEFNIHHKNEDRRDDRFENLEKISHSEHSSMHNKEDGAYLERFCLHCGQEFFIERWRLKEKSRGTFCSLDCYHAHPKKESTRKRQSISLKLAYKEGRRR
jgi:hypothetical protein